jgi:hypothetical protein
MKLKDKIQLIGRHGDYAPFVRSVCNALGIADLDVMCVTIEINKCKLEYRVSVSTECNTVRNDLEASINKELKNISGIHVVRNEIRTILEKHCNAEKRILFSGIEKHANEVKYIKALLVAKSSLRYVPQIIKTHQTKMLRVFKKSYRDINTLEDDMVSGRIVASIYKTKKSFLETVLFLLVNKKMKNFYKYKDLSDLIQEAAECFCETLLMNMNGSINEDSLNIYQCINTISHLGLEKRDPNGSIVFTHVDDVKKTAIRFEHEIDDEDGYLVAPAKWFGNKKMARKIIEMSSEELVCVCNGESIFIGLDHKAKYKANFRVEFTGKDKWSLFYGKTELLKCDFGVPKLPLPKTSSDKFFNHAKNLIGVQEKSRAKFLQILKEAQNQTHGTMIVVSNKASQEAKRLKKQSIIIEPIEATEELIKSVSSIDGAILLDEKLKCYAIGVILDGIASPDVGNPARGARYNSAWRYVTTKKEEPQKTLCFVISEDGGVDMVPPVGWNQGQT